jgi:hypothetical protein
LTGIAAGTQELEDEEATEGEEKRCR